MITRDALCRHLDELLDAGSFRDAGPNGLQVEGAAEVGVLATGTTASLAVIEAAVAAGADALLVHHGLFWGEGWTATGLLRPRLAALLGADCSLLAYHLPLDAHPEVGNNAVLLRRIEAGEVAPFGSYRGQIIGRRGRLPAPVAPAALTALLAATFEHEVFHCPGGPEAIRRVGAVSGGGASLLREAAAEGLDALITGEVGEPTWHEAAELGIHCFGCGHHATECIAVRELGARLAAAFDLEHVDADQQNPL